MEIRKSFKFNGMHIVRNCSSERCKYSLHSHSYLVELFLTANDVDNGMMLVDFGLLKGTVKDFVSSFNNSYSLWDAESQDFKDFIYNSQLRVVELPVSPSAEMYSLVILKGIESIIKNTTFNNGECSPNVVSVRVHETTSGYAESNYEDLNALVDFELDDIKFTNSIRDSWSDPDMWDKLLNDKKFVNPIVQQQI
jgi:6-pyruvoyltetrahydropterin/6-carboxytetrahydropterin synthase